MAEKRPGVQFSVNDQDAADDLEKIPGAIGPSSLALILSERRALRALKLDGKDPTPENIASGAYPYLKRLFFVTAPKRSAAAERFMAFVRSPAGHKILTSQGHWVPEVPTPMPSLSDQRLETIVGRLALAISVVTAAVLPVGHFFLTFLSLSDRLQVVAEVKASAISGLVAQPRDFGADTSSFAYLKNLQVDYLKIDGGFVKGLEHDPIDRAMAETINLIGHIMGIKTVAEFAENEAIVDSLRKIGVNFAQGYGVSMPAPLIRATPPSIETQAPLESAAVSVAGARPRAQFP